jgi:hypothetical protein
LGNFAQFLHNCAGLLQKWAKEKHLPCRLIGLYISGQGRYGRAKQDAWQSRTWLRTAADGRLWWQNGGTRLRPILRRALRVGAHHPVTPGHAGRQRPAAGAGPWAGLPPSLALSCAGSGRLSGGSGWWGAWRLRAVYFTTPRRFPQLVIWSMAGHAGRLHCWTVQVRSLPGGAISLAA